MEGYPNVRSGGQPHPTFPPYYILQTRRLVIYVFKEDEAISHMGKGF